MKSFKKIFLKIFLFTSFLFEVIEVTPHTYQTVPLMSTDFYSGERYIDIGLSLKGRLIVVSYS